MLRNYIKIAIRNLFKHKLFSIVTLSGLILGMAGAILLMMNIRHELSVDKFHQKGNSIYKVYNKNIINGRLEAWSVTPNPLAPALKKDYPEIKEFTRVAGTQKLLSLGDEKLKVVGSYVDPAFLNMFSFPLAKGNASTALSNLNSIVITESLATKMFGKEDPINKIILTDNKHNFIVTGILKDLPNNTSFSFEFLLPFEFQKQERNDFGSWTNSYISSYVELASGSNPDALNKKINTIQKKYSTDEKPAQTFLFPLEKEYLYNRFENGVSIGGRIANVRFMSTLAFIILLIACINFMNLSTARSEKRAKEVGIRKAAGARRSSLIIQFLGESVFLASIAGLLALLLSYLILPAFNNLNGKPLSIPADSPVFWLSAIGFVLITGLLAGSYPAVFLSSFKPVKVLKGDVKNGKAMITPRKILVVIQFIFSVVLINYTLLFQKQMKYTQNRDTGFVKEQLLYHPLTEDLSKNYTLIKDELMNQGIASSVSLTSTPIISGGTGISGLSWKGMEPDANVSFEYMIAMSDMVKTQGLTLVSGRDINRDQFPTDTSACMINETAARVMGLKNPVGEIVKDGDNSWTIVGVIKDFIVGNPQQAIQPLFVAGGGDVYFLNVRLMGTHASREQINKAENIIKKYNPGFLTEPVLADEAYKARFMQSKNVSTIMNVFSMVAIFISCLGLFGLVTYMAENRTKEIGIRKVLGASATVITSLLAKDLMKLVMISIVVASPLAWMLMNFYLNQFEYRTTIGVWILPVAGISAFVIALFTISFQTIRAALANPVKSLRTE